MRITQRQIHIGLFTLMSLGTLVLTLLVFSTPSAQIASKIIASSLFACFGGLLLAYRRGWEYARPIAVVAVTLLMGVGIPASNPDNISQQITWAVLVPPVAPAPSPHRPRSLRVKTSRCQALLYGLRPTAGRVCAV